MIVIETEDFYCASLELNAWHTFSKSARSDVTQSSKAEVAAQSDNLRWFLTLDSYSATKLVLGVHKFRRLIPIILCTIKLLLPYFRT